MIDYQKAIKELRGKLIMTQAESAKFLGFSYTSINRWENGVSKPTTVAKRKIVELCNEYQINLEKAEQLWIQY